MRTHLVRLTVVTTASAFLVAACGGRKPDPVATYKISDDSLTCDGIRAEMSFIDQQVAALIPETKKTGKNVALGTAGLFLIVPFFFMDMSDAERVEIDAYKKRYLALEQAAQKKNCNTSSTTSTAATETTEEAGAEAAVSQTGAAEIAKKLQVLDELHKSGVITTEEYKEKRQEIISTL
jgi:Short C-terminal domain